MAITRIVSTDFWKDNIVSDKYSVEDRYFMLYVLTNPSTKQCGIYHITIKEMAFELGYDKFSTTSILERFTKNFKNIIYDFETNEICILNYLKYSIVKGGKPVEDCLRKELSQVKSKHLVFAMYNHIQFFMDDEIKKKSLKNDDKNSMYVGIKSVFNEYINLYKQEYDIYNTKNNIILKEKENDIYNDNDNDNERIVHESSADTLDQFFERIWKLYPKKHGKGQVSTKKKKELQKIGEDQIVRCIERIIKYYADNKTKDQYKLNGSTFFNSGYVDYLDSNYEQPKEKSGIQEVKPEESSFDNKEIDKKLLEELGL